jgi:hypothetical protein
MPLHSNSRSHGESRDRQAASLVVTEKWWRDRHYEKRLTELGYKLRPRYHPQWQPSWLMCDKEIYPVEDGQATIVRVTVHVFRSSVQVGDS